MILLGILLLLLIIILILKIRDRKLLETVTKFHRGTETERQLVLNLLKSGFPAQTIFHDLYLKNRNGKYSQIDVVLTTKVGLIVFEVKNYKGWIYGTGHQSKWTQVLAFGKKKYQFYNPILQNRKHVKNLKTALTDFQNIPFFSVVVFYGNCEFRDVSFIPKDTFLVKSPRVIQVVRKIIKENKSVEYKSKRDVVNILSAAVANGECKEISEKHVSNIKDMLGDDRIFR